MLTLERLSLSYRGPAGPVAVLRELDFQLNASDFVAIQGPSGCGKTTLLLAAGGLLSPDAGRVVLGGQDVYALGPEARARFRARTVGFVFQQFHLVPYLTVLENVLAPTLAVAIPEARPRAEALLERLGLGPRRRHVPGELSTGERQRVALARALLPGPKALLADEPTGNLDDANAAQVLAELRAFARGGGAVLLVTHAAAAAATADRTRQLREGRLEDVPPVGGR
jgi:ABC-type lipoprotein export system ATPase subunit